MVWSQSKVKVLVVCGPSGSGKSTILKKLFSEFPNNFGFSVSHTTRSPRHNERNGYDYHFTSVEEMKKAIDDGKFIEYATYAGNMYGTSIDAVKKVTSEGKICVLDIDTQGVKQMKEHCNIQAVYTFIMTPSLDDLEKRLRNRGTDSDDSITRRLEWASSEIIYGTANGNFDLVVVNDDLNEAYKTFRNFVLKSFDIKTNNSIS